MRDVTHERDASACAICCAQAVPAWHGVKLNQPDWSDNSHSIALYAEVRELRHFHLILNAYWEPLDFELPSLKDGALGRWRRWVDTSLDSPNDIIPWEAAPPITDHTYHTGPRSVVMLWSQLE